jgi:hypothetical protein
MTTETIFSVRPTGKKANLSAAAKGNALLAIGQILPGCRVVGVTKGQFSLLDLISAVLGQVGAADVLVSTWTPGKREMEAVADMLDRHVITRFRLLVDRSFVTRHPEYVANVQRIFGLDAIRQTRTHAKFALIAAGDFRITIRTSMNFNHNPRFEQFDFDDDCAIYNFFSGVVDELYLSAPAGLDVDPKEVERAFKGIAFRGLGDSPAKVVKFVVENQALPALSSEIEALLAEFADR